MKKKSCMKKELSKSRIPLILIVLLGAEIAFGQERVVSEDASVEDGEVEPASEDASVEDGEVEPASEDASVEDAVEPSSEAPEETTTESESEISAESFETTTSDPAAELETDTLVTTDEDSEGETKSLKKTLKKKPKFKVGARLYGLWEMSDEPYEPLHEFSISMARIKFTWTQWKIVEAVLKLDADQIIEDVEDAALLRDLYVKVLPLRWLGFRMGQFKRPFSRIELKSRRRLPSINRGIVNDYAVEHLMYGGRDIGFMLEGRIWNKIKLDYAIGVFNGMGMNAWDLGMSGFKDITGRLDMKPAKWLWLGFSGSLKFIEKGDLEHFVDLDRLSELQPEDYPEEYTDPTNQELTLIQFKEQHEWMTGQTWMAGMDLGLKFGDFRLVADAVLGENWWFEDYPYLWGSSLILSYKHKLIKGWPLWVEPVVMGEVLTILADWDLWRNRLWQVAPGTNLHIGKYVRLMIGGEFTFAEGTESDLDGSRNDGLWPNEWPGDFMDSKRLLVQLAFSI